jgi:hypothetical protein|nr:MAG TPA: hypothetical protein [Caudoviricetes sp.]
MTIVKATISWLQRDKLLKILSLMMVLSLVFSGYTLFKSLTLKPGQSVTISGGAKVEKPVTSITNAQVDKNGDLVVYYSSGESRNVGQVLGSNGKDGRTPSNSEIQVAVKAYCSTNKCSESPTSAQVMSAVASYCDSSKCKGTDGKSASDDQVALAVAKYCASGKCKGDTGAAGVDGANGTNGVNGQNGADGKSPILNCVNIKDNSGNQTSWVAWKYDGEDNSAYRRMYKIAGDSSCINI